VVGWLVAAGKPARMFLVKFVVKLIHFYPRFFEGSFSGRSDAIEPALPTLSAIE
jgi:hypothetical protein